MNLVPEALLTAVLATAVITDLRSRRIPNWLTYTAAVLGLGWGVASAGPDGLFQSLQGAGLAVALMILPFALGWTGAGDVKLMVAIGAIKGPSFLFLVCLYAALFGGVLAAIVLIRQRKLRAALLYLFLFWRLPGDYRSSLAAGSIPYAPAIAVGTLAAAVIAIVVPSTGGWSPV